MILAALRLNEASSTGYIMNITPGSRQDHDAAGVVAKHLCGMALLPNRHLRIVLIEAYRTNQSAKECAADEGERRVHWFLLHQN